MVLICYVSHQSPGDRRRLKKLTGSRLCISLSAEFDSAGV